MVVSCVFDYVDDDVYEIVLTIGDNTFTTYGDYINRIESTSAHFHAVNGVESEVSFTLVDDSNIIKIYLSGDWGTFNSSVNVTTEEVKEFKSILVKLQDQFTNRMSRYANNDDDAMIDDDDD